MSLLIAAVGAMVISTNGPLPVQGFQPQLVKPSNPVNRYSSSKTRLAKRNVQYDRHKHALFAVSIAADDILTTSMEEQKSTSQCPFAFCHGKQGGGTSLPPLLSNSRHQRTTLFQTKKTPLSSVISPSKVLMFNFKRAIFTFIAKGLLFSKAIRIRNQQLPQSLNSKRIESKLSKSDIKYIETLFDVICEKEHLINLKLPQQAVGDKNELSIAFKFNFVAGVISERLEIKNVKNIVPSYHPEYDTAMRDMINTFLFFSSGVTYEQVLNDPRCAIRALRDQDKRQHQFHLIGLSTLSSEYLNKPVKSQRYLALKHQKMGISPTSFMAVHNGLYSVMVDIVGGSKKLSESKKASLVEYFMKRFSANDTTPIGVIHESYQTL